MFILLPGVLIFLLLLLTAIVHHHLAFNRSDFNPTLPIANRYVKRIDK